MSKRAPTFVMLGGFAALAASLPILDTPGYATLDARRTIFDPVMQREVGLAVAARADGAVRARLGQDINYVVAAR